MDLTPLDGPADEGAVLTVEHPGTGDPTDIEITLAGVDSKRWRRAQHAAGRLALDAAKGGARRVLEVTDDTRCFMLAAVTLSWKNVELDGKRLECSPESAKELYERFPWLREQVDRFVSDRANFFR